MKKRLTLALSIACLISLSFFSCSNEETANVPDPQEGISINLLAANINTTNTELTNINLDNGLMTSFTADCMVLSSRVYDKTTQSFGYTNCDQTFILVNPTTGEVTNSFPLPGNISMAVVDDTEHVLIGLYYDLAAEANRVIRLDLDNGTLLSDLKVEALGPMYTCTQFFDQGNQSFSLVTADNQITTVDAVNGTVVSTVGVNSGTNIIYYEEMSKTLLSIVYDQSTNTNYVEQTNVESGALLQRNALPSPTNFKLCAIGFARSTNSMIPINSDNDVQSINIHTGALHPDRDSDTAIHQ